MKIELGDVSVKVAEKLLYALAVGFTSWLLWTTTSIYQLKQDVALIRQLVMAQSQVAARR